jgi:DNA-binding NarL/FixJ family response regulator
MRPSSSVHRTTPLLEGEEAEASPPANTRATWPVPVIMVGGSGDLRAAMREMLGEEAGFYLAGEAPTCAAALELVCRCQPAVALVDVCLPDRSGFEVVRCMKQLAPACAPIVLSNVPDPFVEDVARMLGATDVWHKRSDLGQLRQMIRRLLRAGAASSGQASSFKSPAQ